MTVAIKGTTVSVGYGSFTYTGYIAETVTVTYPEGNMEVIRDEAGATMTKLLMDPATKLDFTVVVLAAGSVDPPADGDTVGVIPATGSLTSFMSEGSSATHIAGATRLSLSLIKETSMTYA